VEQDQGPVLVTVEYRIDPKDRDGFPAALEGLLMAIIRASPRCDILRSHES
jgi:hypothetical protein